jgi:hypothetical protein
MCIGYEASLAPHRALARASLGASRSVMTRIRARHDAGRRRRHRRGFRLVQSAQVSWAMWTIDGGLLTTA